MSVCHHRFIRFLNQRKIFQLIPEQSAAALCSFYKHIGCDAGCFQFLHLLEQNLLVLRSSPGVSVNSQFRPDGFNGEIHTKKPPAIVQKRCAVGTARQHLHRQAAKGFCRRMHGDMVAADFAQLSLGLIGKLIRHDEKNVGFPGVDALYSATTSLPSSWFQTASS